MTAAPSRPDVLRLHERDNVVVALRALDAGERVAVDGDALAIGEPVPFGHKIATRDIADGGDVVKYGEVIGHATAPIAVGRHVHVHNVASARLPGPGGRAVIRGYRRPTGALGARNHVLVLPSVVCSSAAARAIAADDAVPIVHQHGCAEVGPDVEHTQGAFIGTAANPNVGAALVVGLGCETNQSDRLAARIEASGQRVEVNSIQAAGGSAVTVAWGRERVAELRSELAGQERVEATEAELVVALDDADAPFADELEALVEAAGARLVVASGGHGALHHPELAAAGAQVIVAWCGPGEGPSGFAVCPVIAVAGDADLYAALGDDFDVDGAGEPAAVAATVWEQVLRTFDGDPTASERRGQRDFFLRRLVRTM